MSFQIDWLMLYSCSVFCDLQGVRLQGWLDVRFKHFRAVPLQRYTSNCCCVGVMAFFFVSCYVLLLKAALIPGSHERFQLPYGRLLAEKIFRIIHEGFPKTKGCFFPLCCRFYFATDKTEHGPGRTAPQRPSLIFFGVWRMEPQRIASETLLGHPHHH